MLEIKDIRKSFGDLEVLKGVSLHVEKGDVVAILGPSGSGKTTLLRCINFLETADYGTMIFDGESYDMSRISKRDIAGIRKKTAFVFQSFHLFLNKTALENVTEGLIVARKMEKKKAEEIGKRALDKVGMSDRYSHYPHQLSGGQQQRVAIARALIAKPDIIFADEPTGNLDSKSGCEVMKILRSLWSEMGKTLVIITHDPHVAEMAERQFMIVDGKIAEVGK